MERPKPGDGLYDDWKKSTGYVEPEVDPFSKKGKIIEVLSGTKKWREAYVIGKEPGGVYVHYKGYSREFDEMIPRDSGRLREWGPLNEKRRQDLRASWVLPKGRVRTCSGCGVKIQTEDARQPGYMQPHVWALNEEEDPDINKPLLPEEELRLLLDASQKDEQEAWLTQKRDDGRPLQTKFRVIANVFLDVREESDIDSARVPGETLRFGQEFEVSRIFRSPDGRVYFKLANGKGWVFDWAMIGSVRTQLVQPVNDGAAMIQQMKDKDKHLCLRCFGLAHENHIDDALRPGHELRDDIRNIGPKELEKMLQSQLNKLRDNACVVVVCDIIDFGPSYKVLEFLANELHGKKQVRVRIIANKIDLLPPEVNEMRIKNWMVEMANRAGLRRVRIGDIYLISTALGVGVKAFTKSMQASPRETWVVCGAANAGKSSVMNRLTLRRRKAAEDNTPRLLADGFVVSTLPGTTQANIKVTTRSGGLRLIDTPGLLIESSLLHKLKFKDLRKMVPQKKQTNRITMFVAPSFSLILGGGLARIDQVEGAQSQLTVVQERMITIHRCKTEKAEAAIERNAGVAMRPPFTAPRAQELREKWPLEPHTFECEGRGWLEGCADIVIHGLGFVGITGVGIMSFTVWVPKGVEVTMRDSPLLPYEAKWTTVGYAGRIGWFQVKGRSTRGFEVGKHRRKIKGKW